MKRERDTKADRQSDNPSAESPPSDAREDGADAAGTAGAVTGAGESPETAGGDTGKVQGKDDEIQQLREQLMRVQAEFENADKRREREATQLRKYLLESFVLELLEVKDNLERTIDSLGDAPGSDSGDSGDSDARSGLTLTAKHFNQILTRHSVEEIAPQGEAFNPELHEAMSMQDSEEHAANTVIQVVQKGYRMHERLLRPARVIVASGKAKADAKAAADEAGE